MMKLFACLSVLLGSLWSVAPEAKPVVVLFEARYRGARTLQATFLERYSENGRPVRVEAGRVYIGKPGKMRWEYEAPEKTLFLVDGKTAWFYVPGDHTVTRVPAKQSTDWRTPVALLAGEMKLSRICARVDVAVAEKPEKDGGAVLSCMLKGSETKGGQTAGNDAVYAKTDVVILEVAQRTGELVRVVVHGSGGVDIEFRFADWRFDPPIPDSYFRFEVPLGVAIVNGESPAENKPVR